MTSSTHCSLKYTGLNSKSQALGQNPRCIRNFLVCVKAGGAPDDCPFVPSYDLFPDTRVWWPQCAAKYADNFSPEQMWEFEFVAKG